MKTALKKALPGLLYAFVLAGVLNSAARSQSTWGKIKEEVGSSRKGNSGAGLSDDKITAGLKEALTVSTGNAVSLTGRPDGFLKNAAIKILLPEKLRTVGRALRMAGMGSQVDALEVGMNRAAEQAAPKARDIFVHAVTRMSFSDARQILTGGNTAATDYFKRQSSQELTVAFAPIVHQAMENVGVVRQYDQLMKNSMAASLAELQSGRLCRRENHGWPFLHAGRGREKNPHQPRSPDHRIVETGLWRTGRQARIRAVVMWQRPVVSAYGAPGSAVVAESRSTCIDVLFALMKQF